MLTRILTGTVWLIMRSLNKIHNSLICIVLMFFVSVCLPRNHISLSFDWRDLEWNCCKLLQCLQCTVSVTSLSVQDLAGGGDRFTVGEPVVYMLTVGATVREAFMTFGTLEGLLSAVKSLVFC